MNMPWLKPLWEPLCARLANGSMPHALLFSGPRGLGKRALAVRLAGLVLCEAASETQEACGSCKPCRLMAAGAHPDCLWISPQEDSRQLRIDQIRELSGKVSLTSGGAHLRVFVLDPADAMNVSAANAFLKTLEEPSPGTLLILLATRPERLPATIRSRCQQHVLRPPSSEVARSWLRKQTQADEATVELALDAAAGTPLRALALLEAEDGLDRYRQTLRGLNAVAEGQMDPVSLAERWHKDEELESRLDWWIHWLRQSLWARARGGGDAQACLTVAADLGSLSRYAEQLLKGRLLLDAPVSRELLLEELLIGWRNLAQNGG